ncbi:hypothetical protein HYT18_05245 [Candidatus Microgenomates bacterium]|nr:hypothetical protein [Candidatus Microgenomates bacterium]
MGETAQVDQETAQGISDSLNNAGQPVEIKDVLPVDTGDLVYGIGQAVGDATTGSSKARTTPSRGFLGEFVDRLLKKRQPGEVVAIK